MHLANDFAGSRVYRNLVLHLDEKGLSQVVYCALRDGALVGKNQIELRQPGSSVLYRNILNTATRFWYPYKLQKVSRDFSSVLRNAPADLLHAHTWFSDGAVAYREYLRSGRPYVVTVRNTDINVFFRYMLHLRAYGLKILRHAARIFFISPVYRERLLQHEAVRVHAAVLSAKAEIIPNGIEPYWHREAKQKHEHIHSPAELLYIGNFSRNKNVYTLQQAVEWLNRKGIACRLNLVGGNGRQQDKVLRTAARAPHLFRYHGIVSRPEDLEEIFRSNDIFVMPSRTETFGLVYVEALSQGLPVLYTHNEGIDGYFTDPIGEKVLPDKVPVIADRLERLIRQYETYRFEPAKLLQDFDWSRIADRYISIYQSVANK